jgi:GAF domain-containing protein
MNTAETMLARALEVTGAERAALVVRDDPREQWMSMTPGAPSATPLGDAFIADAVIARAMDHNRAVWLIDGFNLQGTEHPSILDLTAFTLMCMPLAREARVLGALYVDRRASVGEFSSRDRDSFHELCDWASRRLARWLAERGREE